MKALNIALLTGLGVALVGGMAYLVLRRPAAPPIPVVQTSTPHASVAASIPSGGGGVANVLKTTASVVDSINKISGGIGDIFGELGF